jgi:O-antigen/teichoic acid export membrane protein
MKNTLQSSLISKSLVASADQAMLSAMNFLTAIILIKMVSRVEYGYYSIAFTVILFLISIQNAIINAPLAVLLVQKKSTQKREYVSSLCYGQYIAILPAAGFCFVITLLLKFIGFDPTLTAVVISICLAISGILLREFIRSYFFAEEKGVKVFKLDVLYLTIYFGFITITYLLLRISVDKIFFIMGLSALLAGLFFGKNIGWQLRSKPIKDSYTENWKLGKWALGGVIVTHLQNYCYLYFLGAMVGSTAVAEVSAARLLIMPLVFVQAGWNKIVVPHGSKLREQKKINLFFKHLIAVCLIIVFVMGVYITFLMMISGVLQNYLLGEKYANSFNYLVLWGIIFVIEFIVNNASSGLVVLKKFHAITKMNFLTMIITIGCAYFFIRSHGIQGGLIALIIGSTILAVLLWGYLIKVVFLRPADFALKKKDSKDLVFRLTK